MSAHVLQAIVGSAWAIHPEVGASLLDIVQRRLVAGVRLTPEAIAAAVAGRPTHVRGTAPASLAVIPILGVIAQRASMVNDVSQPGGTSTEALSRALQEATVNPAVTAIVLDVDSPGGSVRGVPELAAEIRQARGDKPIVAVANGAADSAAYWLASQADEFVVTPSGEVGSIGVYAMHEDLSKAAELRGVRTTFVHAGAHKVEGHPFAPLSDETRAHVQSQVDAYYDRFVADVARGRGVSVATVRGPQFGQGRTYVAQEAVARGLADRVAPLAQVLQELATGRWRRPGGAQARTRGASPTAPSMRSGAGDVTGDLERRRRALAHAALR